MLGTFKVGGKDKIICACKDFTADIKRFLAIYFGASMNGDQMPDVDGDSSMRWKMTKRKIRFLLLAILLSAVFVVSGIQIYGELAARQKEKNEFEELAALVEASQTDSIAVAGYGARGWRRSNAEPEATEPAGAEEALRIYRHCLQGTAIASAGCPSRIRRWTIPSCIRRKTRRNTCGAVFMGNTA